VKIANIATNDIRLGKFMLKNASSLINLIFPLPAELPENVHIVISTLYEDSILALLSRLVPESNLYKLPHMSKNEGNNLLDVWLKETGRTLQEEQRNEVLESFESNGLPLYLRLVFEEVRHWRSDSVRVRLTRDIPGTIRDLFRRLSDDINHGREIVSRSLGYLAAGKNG